MDVTTLSESPKLVEDVSGDGVVNVQDLVFVASNFGKTGENDADVNGDGVVNIIDLIIVASHLGESTAAASSILDVEGLHGLNPAMIQAWIERAQIEDDDSVAFQLGIAKLQSLLALLIPEETVLLPNYPNPFNPETWIPYQLAEPSEVRIGIYDIRGSLVRELDLGHQREGYYTSRSRAAYWDGRNAVSEPVASGLYFYTLTAGDFSATRKMIIRK